MFYVLKGLDDIHMVYNGMSCVPRSIVHSLTQVLGRQWSCVVDRCRALFHEDYNKELIFYACHEIVKVLGKFDGVEELVTKVGDAYG